MRAFIIPLVLIVFSCSPKIYTSVKIDYENLFGDISNGYPENDTFMIKYNENKVLGSKGRFVVSKENIISNIKIGFWEEYNNEEHIKQEGNYRMGSFLDCCVGGYCRAYYYYKDGLWKYYNFQGELIYEVEFEPVKLKVNTRCGNDTLVYGLIKNIPLKYYDSLPPDKVFELQKIYIDDNNGIITYIPLNDELFIRYERKK